MDLKKEILKLQQNRKMSSETEVIAFETALENIFLLRDKNLIRDLCSGFDDETKHSEVMYGLLHAVENLCDDEYSFFEFAEAIPTMLPHAKEWTFRLNYGILNSDIDRKMYASVIKKVNDRTRGAILSVLEEIKKDRPSQFEKSVDEILDQIK